MEHRDSTPTDFNGNGVTKHPLNARAWP